MDQRKRAGYRERDERYGAFRAPRTPYLVLLFLLAACGGNPTGEPLRFTVPRGSGLSSVADTLAARGVIRWPSVFKAYARFTGAAGAIKPGVYEVRRGTAWSEVLDKLVDGDVVKVSVAVPEGWTSMQIAERIATVTAVPADTVRQLVADTALVRELGVPGPTLEGYLYPATYVFPMGTSPRVMLERMVRRYQQVWTPELRARADSLEMSERDVVALASIVEKEAKQWTERDTIAAVYVNRLRIGMPLQADPTVQYALGSHQARLLYSHIEDVADHPYNTYRRRGLPPGPIASPSEGAIRAALYPADVDFLYFVARPNGTHVFTRTLAEHNRAKAASQRARQAAPTAGGRR